MDVVTSMTRTSKRSASVGFLKAIALRVILAHFPITLLLIMHLLVSISRKVAATTITADSLMSESTLELPTASLSG
jgi:hypothetical protein